MFTIERFHCIWLLCSPSLLEVDHGSNPADHLSQRVPSFSFLYRTSMISLGDHLIRYHLSLSLYPLFSSEMCSPRHLIYIAVYAIADGERNKGDRTNTTLVSFLLQQRWMPISSLRTWMTDHLEDAMIRPSLAAQRCQKTLTIRFIGIIVSWSTT